MRHFLNFPSLESLINNHVKSIKKRQSIYFLLPLLLTGLIVGLNVYLGALFLLPACVSLIAVLYEQYNIYKAVRAAYSRFKKIEASPLSFDKISFIKNQVNTLAKKGGVSAPQVYYDKDDCGVGPSIVASMFTPDRIIVSAGMLRAFGFNEMSKRVVLISLAHELGHKIARDNFVRSLQSALLIIMFNAFWPILLQYAISGSILSLAAVSISYCTFRSLSFACKKAYNRNAEIAADLKAVELTKDKTKKIHHMNNLKNFDKAEGKIADIYLILSYLDKKQVKEFIQSVEKELGKQDKIKKTRVQDHLRKLEKILIEKVPYEKKKKRLINFSKVDKYWLTLLKRPTKRFIYSEKQHKVISPRIEKESSSSDSGDHPDNKVREREIFRAVSLP